MTQLYGFARATADIDALSIVPREEAAITRELGRRGGPLHAKHKIYVDFVAVACVPEDHEERLLEMYPQAFHHLRVSALDPYDFALSKLERNIQRDRDDVRFLDSKIPLDLEVLEARYKKELRWQFGNPERVDLTLKLWIEAIQEERTE